MSGLSSIKAANDTFKVQSTEMSGV